MNTQIRHAAKNWNVIMLTGIYGIPISQPKKKYKPNIVKTNKKGKATFKVKRFKKGTYQAKIIYKGNNYYTKVTKTVKIKLK